MKLFVIVKETQGFYKYWKRCYFSLPPFSSPLVSRLSFSSTPFPLPIYYLSPHPPHAFHPTSISPSHLKFHHVPRPLTIQLHHFSPTPPQPPYQATTTTTTPHILTSPPSSLPLSSSTFHDPTTTADTTHHLVPYTTTTTTTSPLCKGVSRIHFFLT